jgi:hypothetical protein
VDQSLPAADRAREAAFRRTGVRPELWELVEDSHQMVNRDPFVLNGRSLTLQLHPARKVVLSDGVRQVTFTVAEKFVRLDEYTGPRPETGVEL